MTGDRPSVERMVEAALLRAKPMDEAPKAEKQRKKRREFPVTIRGITYPSAAAAAEAIGCKRGTIYAALANGKIDSVTGNAPKPVLIRGVLYPSATAAAKALGVKVGAVYSGLSRGRPDSIGVGPGKLGKIGRGGKPAQRLKVGPLEFPSINEASRRLGYSQGYFSQLILNNRPLPEAAIARAMLIAEKQMRKERA